MRCVADMSSVVQCGVLEMWALWHDVVCMRHDFSGTMWAQCYNVVCWRCGLCGMMWCVGNMSSVVQCGVGRCGLSATMWCVGDVGSVA